MKRVYILSIAFLLSIFTKAQVTITNTDMVSVGNKIVLGLNFDTTLTPLRNSGSPNWNFSNLVDNDTEIWDVQKTEWTGYSSAFPSSKIALKRDSTIKFISVDSSKLIAYGSRVLNPIIGTMAQIKFDNHETVLQFPSTMGNSFSTNSSFSIVFDYSTSFPLGPINVDVDKIKVNGHRQRQITCDSSGTVQIPLGTYSALRVKDYLIEVDSIFANVVGPLPLGYISLPSNAFPGINNPNVDTTTNYSWWANNIGYSVLSFDYDKGVSSNVNFLKEIPVASAVKDISTTQSNVIFPNPTTGKICIGNPNMNSSKLILYSVEGRLIKAVSLSKMENSIDVSNIENGIYSCFIYDSKNSIIYKQKLIITNQ